MLGHAPVSLPERAVNITPAPGGVKSRNAALDEAPRCGYHPAPIAGRADSSRPGCITGRTCT